MKMTCIWGFFYDAQKNGWCSAGMVLFIRCNRVIKSKMGCGKDTNTLAELLSLWGLLWFASIMGHHGVESFQ